MFRLDRVIDSINLVTFVMLIDESLISRCVTSEIVTDADNNTSEKRKIGLDTVESATRNEFLLKLS